MIYPGTRKGMGLAAGIAALLLAGCVSDFYETPRPFEGKHRNDPMLDSILRGASMEIRPVEGLPEAEAVALARAISDAAHEHDIAAVTEEGAEIADRLSGKAEVTSGFAPPLETKIRFSWTLTGADGAIKDTVEFDQPISGMKPELNKREREEIAARTVAWLRASLDREAGSETRAEAPRSKPVILVSPVEGASGDGRVSLTTALAELLAASGTCDVLAASEQAQIPKGRTAYRIKGKVEIGDGGPGRQIVAITWTVTDLVGREIGTITQSNATPRGSLDGPWGDTAYAAAMGARDGLLALISRTEAPPPVE